MAALLRSGSFLRIFSGFRHSLASNAPRYEAVTIQKLQSTQLYASITRSFAAQKPLENATAGQAATPGLDKALYRIDTDIRRTGRISKKDIEEIYGEMKSLKCATSTQSLLLIRCCGSLVPEELPEVRTKLVQDIWGTLHQLSIPLDISHYNALLRVYLENEHKFSPTEFLSMLEQNGIEPNRVTYQRLISRYCQEGDIDGASKILEFMKEKELPVSESVFNALIMGHSRANDMDSARGVLGVMQGAGLEPSSETYTVLMVGLAEHGDMEGIKAMLAECGAADIFLHDRELMEVIYALAVKGHDGSVTEMTEKLQKVSGYQQDTMNLIYRLLNAGCDKAAYEMFRTMNMPQNEEGEIAPVGTFFIKHLVKSNMPVSKVVSYCQEFKKEGLNMYALERALEATLNTGKPDAALALMRVMREDGAPLRAHYFWPIIVHYSKLKQKDMVYNTVKEMISLEVPLTLETFKDYVIPGTIDKEVDHEALISTLKDCGMSVPAIINSCVAYHLDSGDVVAAADLLSKYRTRVTPVLRRELATTFVKTGEAIATVNVLGQMVTNNQETAGEADIEGDSAESKPKAKEPQDVAGMFLLDIMFLTRNTQVAERLEKLLQAMESRGINISSNCASDIQARLGENATSTITSLLERLSSGDLTLQPLSRENQGPLNTQSIAELERRLTEMQIKNMPGTPVLSQLLISYARNKQVEKAEEVKRKLEAEEFPIGVGQSVLLIDMYVSAGKLDDALRELAEMQKRNPDVKLTPLKVMKIAQLMLTEGRTDDAIKLIGDHAPEHVEKREDLVVSNSCWRMVNVVAEKGDLSSVKRLLDVVLDKQIVEPTSTILGPLIKAHLVNDNLSGAMEEFERICKEYRVTPWKHELTQRCIKLEDTEKLQKIMDLSIEVHGEMNSLYDLVFGFIECGRIKQAKKILETPGLRARHNRLEQRCKRYLEEGKITELENLVAVTRDIFDVDRNMMFMYLLQAYEKQNDCDKALGIWTSMQEESIEPSDAFLLKLGKMLKKHSREVPFVMPVEQIEVSSPSETKAPSSAPPQPKSKFRTALKEKDLATAINLKTEIESSGGQLNLREKSELIEALVQQNQLTEATRLTRDMLVAGAHPIPRIFKYLINELAKGGDVENLTSFGKYISETVKKNVSYDNRLSNAYLASGRVNECLDGLIHEIDTASEDDIPHLKQKFPRGGILGFMEKEPSSVEKVKVLSDKYAAKGFVGPANSLWQHLFCEGRHEEAQEIYNKYLTGKNERIMFKKILLKSRENHNTTLVAKLSETLNARQDTSSIAKGLVYSCWVDILCNTSKYDEGLSILEESLKHLSLADYNTTALTRLKAGLEMSNKTFPYTIPEKVKTDRKNAKSSSSSSSDSDSD